MALDATLWRAASSEVSREDSQADQGVLEATNQVTLW